MRGKFAWAACLAAYLAVWAVFGLAYWRIAVWSPDSYTVQQDVLVKAKTRRFLKAAGAPLTLAGTAGALFAATDPGLWALAQWYDAVPEGPVPNFGLAGFAPIGNAWADYYCAKYLAQGDALFTYRVREARGRYLWLCVTLYALERTQAGTARPRPSRTVELVVPAEGFEREGTPDKEAGWLPIPQYFHRLAARSVAYPDGDVVTLSRIDQSGEIFGPLEFLYFSAVTMATLGYGDISPNCPLVRGMVMAQMLLGMALFALFSAALYDALLAGKGRGRLPD